MNNEFPDISIVVPLYNEEACLMLFYAEIKSILEVNGMSFELICVDDGSDDKTWELIETLKNSDLCVKGVRLKERRGKHYALYSGMKASCGRAVITLDGDGEHPPALIPALYKLWMDGNEVVYTKRVYGRDISRFKVISSYLFYKFFYLITGIYIEDGYSDYFLLDRSLLVPLLSRSESAVFFRAVLPKLNITKNAAVKFETRPRYGGKSKFNLSRMLMLGGHVLICFVSLKVK